jgi:hypothetical protein
MKSRPIDIRRGLRCKGSRIDDEGYALMRISISGFMSNADTLGLMIRWHRCVVISFRRI